MSVFLKKKKQQKNMLCISLGHLPRALLPGCGVHQVCPAYSQNSDEGPVMQQLSNDVIGQCLQNGT